MIFSLRVRILDWKKRWKSPRLPEQIRGLTKHFLFLVIILAVGLVFKIFFHGIIENFICRSIFFVVTVNEEFLLPVLPILLLVLFHILPFHYSLQHQLCLHRRNSNIICLISYSFLQSLPSNYP